MPLRSIAANPLPWILGPDMSWNLDYRTLAVALPDLRTAGFAAVQADIPRGSDPAEYRAFLEQHGVRPAPSYFSADFADAGALPAIVEHAKAHAAAQAELGLDVSFVAHDLVPERIARPAVGADPDPSRIPVIADGLVAAADAGITEGVAFALHPHVGSRIEVEEEVRGVLAATAGTGLAFGPDTGHLAWAGMDVAAIFRDHADRIRAIHVKDVDAEAVAAARNAEADYARATNELHVWTEPGRGAIDFPAVLAELPVAFNGWVMVEIDVPNLPDRLESLTVARRYLDGLKAFREVPA